MKKFDNLVEQKKKQLKNLNNDKLSLNYNDDIKKATTIVIDFIPSI